jgi:hypothetical protein
MKKQMIFGLLGLAFIASLGVADDIVPVAVSPGAENGPAVVRQSCPTFSWTAVSWALTYKVVVFEAGDGETPAYEKITAEASPVLVKEIPGKALSWTPSADEQLVNGGKYVWYVGAMVNAAQGNWSEGREFVIAETSGWGVVAEQPATMTQPTARIEERPTRKTLRDEDLKMTEAAKEDFNLADDLSLPELSDILGTEGANNTFYGTSAGNATMTGTENSFFGNVAGKKNTTGSYNTFLGRAAGYNNTSGIYNTFVGRTAGLSNTTAKYNTFVGFAAGRFNTTGYYNTFLGHLAGYTTTTGADNVFIGSAAGRNNTASDNTFLGHAAGYKNTTGNDNTYVGAAAGFNNLDGYRNVFVGGLAGYMTTTGDDNVFVGVEAGRTNDAGYDNTFLGRGTGFKNTQGWSNTYIGRNAGSENSFGYANTFVGSYSGCLNTGNYNVFIGEMAGQNNTGSNNVFIGYGAGWNATGSNKLYITNANTLTSLIYGDFSTGRLGINNAAPGSMFVVGTGGAVCDGTTWTDGSSREVKENIEELTAAEALRAFEEIKPVKFNYKQNKEEARLGFIAEDVPDLVAMNGRKGLSPMDMVAMLTKVVQEQQKALLEQQKAAREQMKVNQEQQKEISELKEKITKLEKK